ncbi:hypothetical protein EDC94DRAFT_605206 [Helicostylum pulchrum]|nr:hypothetical protein EDC94DRAFT_605206 [Helicostylum pulchrum]
MTPTEKKDENFVRVVSFDAMTNTDLPDYSFTLRGKSTGFKRTRRSRTFMVATDLANYSEYALTWATDEIMDEGDELIVLRVLTVDMNDKKGDISNQLDFEAKQSRETAKQVMNNIMKKTQSEKKISVIIEFVIGKVQETIQKMIAMYQPSLLIVGTRGLSEFKGMLLGSISKYCLQHSPVPVAVVRPEGQKAKKSKRFTGLMKLGSLTSEEEETSTDRLFNRLSIKQRKYRSRSTSPS